MGAGRPAAMTLTNAATFDYDPDRVVVPATSWPQNGWDETGTNPVLVAFMTHAQFAGS
jgi:hypothetical protein